jgi:hypothetical protein
VRDALDIHIDEIRQPVQVFATTLDAEGRPRIEGLYGRADRQVRLEGGAARDVSELPLPVQGRTVLEGVLGSHAVTVDEVVG